MSRYFYEQRRRRQEEERRRREEQRAAGTGSDLLNPLNPLARYSLVLITVMITAPAVLTVAVVIQVPAILISITGGLCEGHR